jgi:hypothetical protein
VKLAEYLKESYNLNAAWITPAAQVLDCGAQSHISFVLKNPQKFGLTSDDISGCTRYQDAEQKGIRGLTTYTDGIEDKSWDCVIKKVLSKGFLRLRRVRSNKYSYIWFIDVYNLNTKTKKTLADWAYSVKEKDDKVMISVMDGINYITKGLAPKKDLTIAMLSNLFEEHELLQLITLNEMEDLINDNLLG